MNRIAFIIVAISVLAGLMACAANDRGLRKVYTRDEYVKMTYCVGMSDTAFHIATSKVQGKSAEDVTKFYSANKEYARMNTAIVDKIYSDKFTSVWDYTVSFFDECALNMADVPKSRVNMASYCHQNSMIAMVAHNFKASGAPKESAYKYFAPFKNETPNRIIDQVYASSKGRAEIGLDIWQSCMKVLSADR